jgi:MFS family permease
VVVVHRNRTDDLQGDSPLKAGVRILPFIVMIVFFALVNGALMPKFGYYMPWYVAGSILSLIGSALMYTIKVDTSPSAVYGYTVLVGIGVGSYVVAGFAIVPFLVAPHDANNAVGFMAIAQVVGGNIFLSMAGCMYQNFGHSKLLPLLPGYTAEQVSGIIAGTSNAGFQALSPQLKLEVVEQITQIMTYLWAIMIAGAAFNVVLAPFLSVSLTFADVVCLHDADVVLYRERKYTPFRPRDVMEDLTVVARPRDCA